MGGDALTFTTTVADVVAVPLSPKLVAAGISVLTFKFLYAKYEQLYVFTLFRFR